MHPLTPPPLDPGPHAQDDVVPPFVADLLATDLSTVARSLQADHRTDVVLATLVATATVLVPGAQNASISLLRRSTVTSQHQTSQRTREIDVFQSEVGEGPCLDAVFRQRSVRVTDMRRERRWPTFAPRARELGVGSMASFRLYARDHTFGALNLFSPQPDAFDDEAEQIGLLLASHAAVALAATSKLDDLARAVQSRDLIGQAKGMLMERYRIDAQQAFGVLTRASQATNVKLHDIARELVSTGHVAVLGEPTAVHCSVAADDAT